MAFSRGTDGMNRGLRQAPGLRRPDVCLACALAALALGIGGAGAEVVLPTVRRWFVQHPFTVALFAGLLVVVLTVFGVERLLARTESRRWKHPALMSLDIYVSVADRVTHEIDVRLDELLRSLANPPARDPIRVGLKLELLAEQDPAKLWDLSAYILGRTDELGLVAMAASATIVRHEPDAAVIADIFEVQRCLGAAGRGCRSLGIVANGGERLRSSLPRHRDEIARDLQTAIDVIWTKYAWVRDADQRPGDPNRV